MKWDEMKMLEGQKKEKDKDKMILDKVMRGEIKRRIEINTWDEANPPRRLAVIVVAGHTKFRLE